MMKKYGLIGYPIAHSQSPRLFKEAYGGKYAYDLIEEEEFERAWERFLSEGYLGINVTAPFKELALEKADVVDVGAQKCRAANIIVRESDGLLHAYNSDYLAVKKILKELCVVANRKNLVDVIVIGGGGAGRAAYQAAMDLGLNVELVRHSELAQRELKAHIVVFTLPKAAEGYEKIECENLLEANYKDPCCKGLKGVKNYIPGEQWLKQQALTGYKLLTGEPVLN